MRKEQLASKPKESALAAIRNTLSILVHSEPGAGKSWFGQTSPRPILTLDAEGGSRYAKRHGQKVRKVSWDPLSGPPPEADGTWDTCVVIVHKFEVMQKAWEWLNTYDHGFKSLVIDTLDEIQKRCKDDISGGETMTERNWGQLLVKMEQLVRLQLRDLTFHPTHPLDAVVILAHTDLKKNKYRPAVQGALGVSLPGYVDVEGYTDSSQVVQAPLIPKTEASEESKERYCSAPRYLVFYELGPETLEYARGLAASWGYSAIKYAEVPGRLYIEPVYGQAVRAAAGK